MFFSDGVTFGRKGCFFSGLPVSFVVCVCAAKEVLKWHG